MGDADMVRELHEAYVWKVNQAVAEGRMDLVEQFSDEYTDEALDLMTSLRTPGCGRADCASCARSGSPPTVPTRRSWFWSRLRSAR